MNCESLEHAMKSKKTTQPLNITVDATELSAPQQRVLKTVTNLMAHVMTTDEE